MSGALAKYDKQDMLRGKVRGFGEPKVKGLWWTKIAERENWNIDLKSTILWQIFPPIIGYGVSFRKSLSNVKILNRERIETKRDTMEIFHVQGRIKSQSTLKKTMAEQKYSVAFKVCEKKKNKILLRQFADHW